MLGVHALPAYRDGGKYVSYGPTAPVALSKSWLPGTTVFGMFASSRTFNPAEVYPHCVGLVYSLTRSPSCTTMAVLRSARVSTAHWACWAMVPWRLLYV